MSLEVSSLPSPTGPFKPNHMHHHGMRSPSFEARRHHDAGDASSVSMASRFKDLVKFLSSVSGDLSNVSAPPFFLAPSSVVEVGHCWAQRPGVFAAPALEPDPARRCMLVMRMLLIAMRSQFYVAGSPTVSIKKPLNAFLGELFLASWTHDPAAAAAQTTTTTTTTTKTQTKTTKTKTKTTEDAGLGLGLGLGLDLGMDSGDGRPATTRLVAEQVSHHPPITAMAIVDDEHGIRADGYARVEMTFSSSVDIRQVGHAVVTIDRHGGEQYLIPLPDVKVRGFLSGRLYPEVLGTYTIVSSAGYVCDMTFSGAGVFRGRRNAFEARVRRRGDDHAAPPLYEASGVWSEGWTIRDGRTGAVLERYEVDAAANRPAPADLAPVAAQDPWESRRAWAGVAGALGRGDLRGAVAEKSRLERAQRRLRGEEAARGEAWRPRLFASAESGPAVDAFRRLAAGTAWEGRLHADRTKGVWRVDDARVAAARRPFRGDLTPLG